MSTRFTSAYVSFHASSSDSLTALTRTLNFLVIYLIVHENTGLEGVFFVAVRAPINLDL
jgi:hypothetical protein